MKIDEVFLKRLERLARLELKKEEKMTLRKDLEKMIDSFQRMKNVDPGGCRPMVTPFRNKNNFRDDKERELSDYSEIRELSPQLKEGQIVVSEKVREKES